jgi:hypothetical protein
VAIGNVFPVADLDYWSFDGERGDKVYAAVETSGDAANSQNSELRLIGTDGTTVLETDLDDGQLRHHLVHHRRRHLPGAGTFYLQSSTTGHGLPPSYHLHFRLQSGRPPRGRAQRHSRHREPLPANGWVSGSRGTTTDQDWYSSP